MPHPRHRCDKFLVAFDSLLRVGDGNQSAPPWRVRNAPNILVCLAQEAEDGVAEGPVNKFVGAFDRHELPPPFHGVNVSDKDFSVGQCSAQCTRTSKSFSERQLCRHPYCPRGKR